MASYFRQVPNFDYISRNPGEKYISEYTTIKNLFKRGKLREDIFKNLVFFEKYSIVGDERPDNVAYKFYKDSTLDWIVLLSNNILNIQSEWPMTQRTFDEVMLEKYGSYEELYSGIHHYETEEIKNSLGISVLKPGLKINPTWKTNGNFLEIVNSKIDSIYSGNGEISSSIITVELVNSIPKLEVGDQIIISNVPESQYNGQHIVTEIISHEEESITSVTSFRYEVDFIPDISSPTLADPRKEEVLFTIPDDSDSEKSQILANSYYYEYWDNSLGYSVQVPSTSFVNAITNYDYEMQLEEKKRNIYVLKSIYLSVIFNDMDNFMPYKKDGDQYISDTLKRGDNIRLYQ